METLYAGLFIVGGATLLLLGILLYASERKLRNKDEVVALPRNNQSLRDQRSEIHSAAESMTTKNEPAENISSGSGRLEERRRTAEELRSEQRQSLEARDDNHELQRTIVNLTNQLHTTEARLRDSGSKFDQISHQNANLRTELADLKQQLEASRATVQEFEAEQQRLLDLLQKRSNAESREIILINEQGQLQAQIAALRRELSSENEELKATRQRLLQSEDVCRKLNVKNCRLSKEISQYRQETLALREENEHQTSALRQQMQQLQTKERPLDSDVRAARKLAVGSSAEGNRRFRVISATVAFTIVGAIGLGFIATSSEKETANVPQESTPYVVASKTQVSKQTPVTATKPAARLKGTFKTTRATELFNGPSENSALIGTLAPGMKINVIDSRGGWLEVGSKHGRTSGFMRQEAAVKIHDDQS